MGAPTDVNDLLRSIERPLRHLVGERVDVHMNLVSRPAIAAAAAGEVKLVLLEMAALVRDTMEAHGTISISTRRVSIDAAIPEQTAMPSGDYVEIAVRATPSSSSVLSADAMASAWLSNTLDRIDGYIEDGAGDGAIRLFLRAPERADEGARALDVKAALDEETILLVEDEDDVREVIAGLLRSEGFHVLEACDGDDGLNVAAAHAAPIALVISDVVMPRMNGRELCDRLRSWYPKIRFLFVSGYPASAPNDTREPVTRFLPKPFTADSLYAAVRSLLDRTA